MTQIGTRPPTFVAFVNDKEPWKQKTITDYIVKEIQVPIFINGELVYTDPKVINFPFEMINGSWLYKQMIDNILSKGI